jgi:sugar lactone lactonase YvrE
VAGYGAAWAADYEHPLIVRISPGRPDGEIAAAFGADDHPSAGRGPRDVASGLGSIWVLSAEGSRLVRVDPAGGTTRSHELPFRLTRICAEPEALYGIAPLGDDRVART